MKKSLKNIFNLSKLFIMENNKSISIFNLEKRELNNKSILFWAYILLFFGIFYLSSKIIDYTISIGKPQIFLNVFLLFLNFLIILRTIMISANVFYFSKDIENILHLPFKPVEILISKLNTVLCINYEIELVFAIISLLYYIFNTFASLPNLINFTVILVIFPIFATSVVTILMIILMKLIKIFKKKETMQLVLSFLLTFVVMIISSITINYVFNNQELINKNPEIVLNSIDEKIIEVNNFFPGINQISENLQNNSFFTKLINYVILFAINLIAFLLFTFIGRKLYLEQLLKAKFYYKTKKIKIINLNKKCKRSKISISYIKKEFKTLIKNSMFLIQSIYPVIILTVVISLSIIYLAPLVIKSINNSEYGHIKENLKFNIEAVCLIIGALQIIGLFNYTSITAFSREGKNTYIIKTLPISLYKQFIYKNFPQVFLNTICSIAILIIIKITIYSIEFKYIFIMFILSTLLTIINSFILCLIDLLMPKLMWEGEYEILKSNKNKLLQYVLIILNIILFISINNVLKRYNLNISLFILFILLMLILISINVIIYKMKSKLFKKII